MTKAKEILGIINIQEMSNLRPVSTGLPVFVWLDDMGVDRKNKHQSPRLKIAEQRADNFVATISIAENPEILAGDLDLDIFNKVKEWIILNYDILVKQWNGEIEIIDMKPFLKKV